MRNDATSRARSRARLDRVVRLRRWRPCCCQAIPTTPVAALIQGAAAAVVAATATRLRPVLVPLTITVTTVLTTAEHYVRKAVATCIDLTEVTSTPCGPRPLLPDELVTMHLHTIIT